MSYKTHVKLEFSLHFSRFSPFSNVLKMNELATRQRTEVVTSSAASCHIMPEHVVASGVAQHREDIDGNSRKNFEETFGSFRIYVYLCLGNQ